MEADDENKELAATLRGAKFAPGAADDGVAVGLLNRGAESRGKYSNRFSCKYLHEDIEWEYSGRTSASGSRFTGVEGTPLVRSCETRFAISELGDEMKTLSLGSRSLFQKAAKKV